MNVKRVRKAVIPVAGLGTRFLPATKAVPKELLPIVDIPAIQVVIEEALASGLEEVILITGRGKGAILDHFDHSYELEDTLHRREKYDLIARIEKISEMVRVVSVRQKRPLGLGHAVLCARAIVGDEPFAVMLPDDIFESEKPATRQLVDAHREYGTGVVSLLDVPREHVSMYGIIRGEPMTDRLQRIIDLVEKPSEADAPSTFAVSGRYVLPPTIFEHLAKTQPGHSGEIQLTDALVKLARDEGLMGLQTDAVRHDIGDKLGYLKANIAHALKREDMGDALRAYMRELLAEG
jgi:UTP--glucose-1-phosphate uridylyltransferase